ncbi:MAG: acyltransferase [Candidatus Omnitrophota bacterium]
MKTQKNDYFCHPTSCVEEGATIGQGTKIWFYSHILKGAKIGQRCHLGQNVVVHPTAVIGNGVKIQNNVSVYDAVTLEDDVFCGPSCVFTNVINPRSAISRNSAEFFKKTLVKKGATIGANATILCGITIGRFAFVGAGAVVTKSVPDFGLFFGNPARLMGWMCACGTKIKFLAAKGTCVSCKAVYKKSGKVVVAALKKSKIQNQ